MASCNGCTLARLKQQYGSKLVKRGDSWYLHGEAPATGQSSPFADTDGTPLCFVAWFMSEEHSLDEDCRLTPGSEGSCT